MSRSARLFDVMCVTLGGIRQDTPSDVGKHSGDPAMNFVMSRIEER